MGNSAIEWTDKVWNPVTGCTKVSQGCNNCYANSVADRFFAKQYPLNADGTPRQFTDVRTHDERLDIPLHWKKPSKVFVNSMSDLFHEAVDWAFLDRVWTVFARCPQHTFQILTKRPQRMLMYMKYRRDEGAPALPNVWLGVSVEDQKTADERIPLLLQTPAVVRWISAEPLLGPINLDNGETSWLSCDAKKHEDDDGYCCDNFAEIGKHFRGLDWVVVGGESGPNARPMNAEWAQSLRDQCAAANVPFFFKQWGEWAPGACAEAPPLRTERIAELVNGKWHFGTLTVKQSEELHRDDEPDVYRLGKKTAGRQLDGVEHNEFPRSDR